MPRYTTEKVGRGPCPSCGETVAFRLSAGGMLCHRCEACDSTGYAEPGGVAYRKRMASLTSRPEPEEKPAAAQAPKAKAPAPKPAEKPAPASPLPTPATARAFSLEAL